MTSIGNELARKIRSPEHFTDLMTNTGKANKENKRLEDLCNYLLIKHQIYDAMGIIVKKFFEEDFPCFSPKKDSESHSIFFTLHGFDFQVIKGLSHKVMKEESEFGEKTLYYNPIILKVNGEEKLGMRFLTKKTYLSVDNTIKEIDINELESFNGKYDNACLKPIEWLYSLQSFYNRFCLLIDLFKKYGKSCSDLSDLSEKAVGYLKNIRKNIQIDPEILQEFS